MKIVIEINSTLRLRLEPETVLEAAFLKEAAERSEKGATTILAAPSNSASDYVLEVRL